MFPGHSHRVSGEIEREFAKYSVRILETASLAVLELCSALVTFPSSGSSSSRGAEVGMLWKRARSYRDRVFGVYLEVLCLLYQETASASTLVPPIPKAQPQQQQQQSNNNNNNPLLTPYGNNRITGDIGDLSGVTVRYMYWVHFL